MKYVKICIDKNANALKMNKKHLHMEDKEPISLYDADRQRLIGVFVSMSAASRYLYPYTDAGSRHYKVRHALQAKKIEGSRLKDSPRVKCRVVVRIAKSEHAGLLGDKKYFVSDGYPQPGLHEFVLGH